MAYVKIDWTEQTAITHTRMNLMETQYDEFYNSLFDGHNHDSRYYTEAEADARFFNSGNDGSGSGLDADTVDGYSAAQIEEEAVPRGTIAIWSGSQASIPSGWVLCNGVNGTPDLRDKFVVGAGDSYAKGATGGYASRKPTGSVTIAPHALTVAELPEHQHSYVDYYCNVIGLDVCTVSQYYCDGWDFTDVLRTTGNSVGTGDGAHGHPGSTIAFDAYDNKPPYYALCWIMRELA
ncbi:TPA_asm: tail protein [Caudoviricetes sp. vir515]|nr:TPA_asm: tail protein [Caudoviricetes sp. vir515]